VLHNDLKSFRQHNLLRHRVRELGEELVEATIKAELARHAIDGGEIGKGGPTSTGPSRTLAAPTI